MAKPNYETKRENKLIGLEIEFYGVHFQRVVNKLKTAGINVEWMGYTHQTTTGWKLVYDVSVNPTDCGTPRGGLELVSPPLNAEDMERQLKIVTATLDNIGAKVDKTCGVHVHHEIDDLKFKNIQNIYSLYYRHQNGIEEFMPKSRRNSRWCRRLDRDLVEDINNSNSIREIQLKTRDRYKCINFTSYVKYGTIEFRQHSGSTDFDKIWNWIMITQAVVHSAKEYGNKTIKLDLPASYNETMQFNKESGIFKTQLGVYMRDRKRELKRKYEQTA